MKKIIALSSAIVVTTLSSLSHAGADCTEYPKSQWMSVLDLQKRIINEYGFSIKNFKVDDAVSYTHLTLPTICSV